MKNKYYIEVIFLVILGLIYFFSKQALSFLDNKFLVLLLIIFFIYDLFSVVKIIILNKKVNIETITYISLSIFLIFYLPYMIINEKYKISFAFILLMLQTIIGLYVSSNKK